MGVKSMKYYKGNGKSVLAFYLFNGDFGIIEQDFIDEKNLLSAEKKINQMNLEGGQIDDTELDNIVLDEEFQPPLPISKDVEMTPQNPEPAFEEPLIRDFQPTLKRKNAEEDETESCIGTIP